MEEVTLMTRQERRAQRQLRFVTNKEARLAALRAHLGYKVSGETGALRPPTKMRIQYRSDGRNGPTYLVGINEARFARPILHREWRRLMANR